ncbi:MAG: NAD(+) synthase [Planctomycetota bacterium]
MTTVRIAAATLNQTPLGWTGNLRRCVESLAQSRDAGAAIVCLPELCLSGYGCEDAFYAQHVREHAAAALVELCEACHGLAAIVGLPIEVEGKLYNAAACVADGELLGCTLKQFLADDGIHYEPRWFRPWPAGRQTRVSVAGRECPVGDLVYDVAGVRLGVEICRDAWVVGRPAKTFAQRGVTLAMNPSASHFAFGKQDIRKRLVCEGSRLIEGPYVYTNLVGNESGRSVYDGGVLIAEGGELVHEGARFLATEHSLVVADVEVRPPQDAQTPDAAVVVSGWTPAARPDQLAQAPSPQLPAWEASESIAFEEFARGASLALHDYRRKCRASGFVLSLSGGADSAAVALLVGLIQRLHGAPTPLTTVYQATSNSGGVTRSAAAAVADAVGAEHHEWEIDGIVADYTRLAEQAMGRPLSWEADDLALQNIQSRARSPGVWMLANLKNALLLTTGNRSEAAVGYATMDGDTSGGYAPIAGVSKQFLLDWLRWMEAEGPHGIGPTPALAAISAQQPTAELRPPEAGQTDEADLMPYAVLEVIERSAVGDLDPRGRTLERLAEAFPQHAAEQHSAWLDRFEHLWRISQWKRERLAPSLHLDVLSVDPKTWRRWPILSGS